MTIPYQDAMAPLRTAVSPAFAAAVATDIEQAYQTTFGLGEALAARRTELQLSQVQLAEATGIPQADISRIERGKANPTLATLTKLFVALDLKLNLQPAHAAPRG